ncbi:MAG: amidohydrolase family protein [Chloroflexota bacterium]
MIVEWNAHMFSSDTDRYPVHPNASYNPGRRGVPDPLAEYLARLDQEGIDKAVLVHPEPYGDDHRLVLNCLDREPDRLRGTALFYPNDPAAPAKLERLIKRQPKIVAFRFHAHRGKEEYLHSFDDESVRALWRKSAELGLIVDLHIGPNYAAQAEKRIREFPATLVLIDHLAEAKLGTPIEYADVLALAECGNVYMKLSGINHFASDGPLFESARRFTRLAADAYGPDRMVWGSGTPKIVDTHLAHWSDAARAQVRGGNLARLLKWE